VKLLAVVLAVPTLLFGWLHLRDERLQGRLGSVASAIAARDVEVDCQGPLARLLDVQRRHGEVRFDANGVPEGLIYLARPTCNRLRAFAARERHPELDCLRSLEWRATPALPPASDCYRRASPTVYALLVLAHEAYHTAGVADEPAANCYAVQALAYASTRLGAPEEEGALVARAMAALVPLQPTGYATGECRAGAQLDLTPESEAFPTELPIAAPLPLPPTAVR
jgi:hypothetical protein